MASPVYNTAAFRRRRTFGGRRRQRWRLAFGRGSMFGGNTPTYLGVGQPTADNDGALIGDGTPVYRTPPAKTAAATTPSTTPSGATAPQPATVATPQSATTALVVPRS